jgi:hypothetical protein
MTRFLLILCVLYSTAIAGDESHQVRKKVHLETITGILRAYAPGHAQYSQRVDVIPLEGPRVDTLPDLFSRTSMISPWRTSTPSAVRMFGFA